MTHNQANVLAFLHHNRGWPVSPAAIGKKVGGTNRHTAWGTLNCLQLVEMGYAERTDSGNYFITDSGIQAARV